MNFIYNNLDKVRHYFIGEIIAQTIDEYEKDKIRMFYWYCLLNAMSLVAFIPYLLNGDAYLQLAYVLGTILYLFANLFYIKIFKAYKGVLRFLAFISPILVLSLIIFMVPSDLSIFMTYIFIILSLVIFTLNDKWTYSIVISTIACIGIAAYLKSIGIHSGELIGVEMIDQTQLKIDSMVKIGSPMILLVLALANFVKISKSSTQKLAKNIAKQEKLNTELKESQEQFRTLVEGAEDLVYELTPEGNFKYVNPAFEKVTGYAPSFIKGLQYSYLIHPMVIGQSRKYFEEKEYALKDNDYLEFPIITKSGEVIWIGQKVNYVLDENNNLEKYFCISRDITKQKQIRENLKKAKAEAEKAAMIKAQFLSAMSHEIRTPINAVLGTIHLMADENPRQDQVPHLNTLKFSAENLMGLVSHILDYNNLDSDKIVLRNSSFNLMDCMIHTKAGIDQLAKEKGIDFDIEIDEILPKSLMGDSLRISQILSNLAHNAVKYTDLGGVLIQALEHLRGKDFVQIYFAVTDTGKGIPQEKVEAIFEKFTQVNDDTIREGTGLGLAIAKKIATLLNSEIAVESTENKGSKFSLIVEFKLVEASEPKHFPVQKGLQIKTQKKLENSLTGVNILLVEDNIINQKVAGKLLTRWDADFCIAENGKIAVEKIQKKDYDIVLMDIQMPVMDGIKATIAIRAMGGKFARIPIVALTASAVLEVRQNALEAGLDDFLTKPFKPEILNKTILKHVKKEEKKEVDSGVKALSEINFQSDVPGPGE